MARGILSGLAGYGAGRLLQSVGAREFWSSLGGGLASMYASDQLAETFGSSNELSSLGHISESRNWHLLEVEIVGFNRQQFNSELQQIKDTIFQEATTEGISTADAVEIAESFEDEVSELVQEVADLQKSVREPATESVKPRNFVPNVLAEI